MSKKGSIRRRYATLHEAFWVNVTPQDPALCWPWQGFRTHEGYGKVRFQYSYYLAHRLSYVLHYTEPPRDLMVCHHCDNPSCVNPHHLFVGTHTDNMRDCVQKGRKNFCLGERHGMSKLTEADIQHILRLAEIMPRGKQRILAERFGVRQQAISRILSGKRWGHLRPPS